MYIVLYKTIQNYMIKYMAWYFEEFEISCNMNLINNDQSTMFASTHVQWLGVFFMTLI